MLLFYSKNLKNLWTRIIFFVCVCLPSKKQSNTSITEIRKRDEKANIHWYKWLTRLQAQEIKPDDKTYYHKGGLTILRPKYRSKSTKSTHFRRETHANKRSFVLKHYLGKEVSSRINFGTTKLKNLACLSTCRHLIFNFCIFFFLLPLNLTTFSLNLVLSPGAQENKSLVFIFAQRKKSLIRATFR